MFVESDTGLQSEVTFRGKEEFGIKYDEIHGNAWILADSDKDIILDVKCFKLESMAHEPELLLELYVDGVLRNVIKLRTGRGLAENQLAEAMVDRGVVLSEDGTPLLKRFRFTDLDIDDVLNSRVVKEAGVIEIRIIQAGPLFNEEDDIPFELPQVHNDRGSVSLFCGELNNTVGVRFDDGEESVRDTKEVRLKASINMMVDRQNRMLGATLAIFSFNYASDAILLHLGMIPPDHKKYNEEMASERVEVRTRYEATPSRMLVDKAVCDSDYSLSAKIGELNLLINDLPMIEVPIQNPRGVQPMERRTPVTPNRVTKTRETTVFATPQKRTNRLQMLPTPPNTPEVEQAIVVYDMTQDDEEIVEIICID